MLEIENINEVSKYKIKKVYKVENYLVIDCGDITLLTDGEKIYNLSGYHNVNNVFIMGDILCATVIKDGKDILINVENCEELYSQRTSYYSGIFKQDDEHITTLGDESEKVLYNIKTKKFINPRDDLKFGYILAKGIYQFENSDIFNKQYYVVDEDSKILYECDKGYPHIIDDDLLIHYTEDKKIKIISSLLTKEDASKCDTITVEKGENILGDPVLYQEKYIAVITVNGVSLLDTKLNEVKHFDLSIDGEVTNTEVDKNIFIIEVKKDGEKSCVALFLDSGKVIRHRGMVVLPFWDTKRRTIRCIDLIPNKEKLYPNIKTFAKHSLIDENGELIISLNASDSWIIESGLNNKFLFFDVECEGNKVYNLDTKELKDVPYYKIEYPADFEYKCTIGYGFKQDGNIDFFGEDLEVKFTIDPDEFNICGEDFRGYFVNELLWLVVPKSNGPRTFFRHLLIDKQGNIIYDSYYGRINVVGSYFQIVEEDNTMFVNSTTKEISSSNSNLLPEFSLPENVSISDGELLIKKLS